MIVIDTEIRIARGALPRRVLAGFVRDFKGRSLSCSLMTPGFAG
jgi:hypothetical protein